MPIYEYQCKACNEKVELLQKIDEAPARKCPACGKNQLMKLVSAAGFRLKGAGWYETDFKKGNKKNLHGSEKGAEKSDKSSESAANKPSAKAESSAASG